MEILMVVFVFPLLQHLVFDSRKHFIRYHFHIASSFCLYSVAAMVAAVWQVLHSLNGRYVLRHISDSVSGVTASAGNAIFLCGLGKYASTTPLWLKSLSDVSIKISIRRHIMKGECQNNTLTISWEWKTIPKERRVFKIFKPRSLASLPVFIIWLLASECIRTGGIQTCCSMSCEKDLTATHGEQGKFDTCCTITAMYFLTLQHLGMSEASKAASGNHRSLLKVSGNCLSTMMYSEPRNNSDL